MDVCRTKVPQSPTPYDDLLQDDDDDGQYVRERINKSQHRNFHS